MQKYSNKRNIHSSFIIRNVLKRVRNEERGKATKEKTDMKRLRNRRRNTIPENKRIAESSNRIREAQGKCTKRMKKWRGTRGRQRTGVTEVGTQIQKQKVETVAAEQWIN